MNAELNPINTISCPLKIASSSDFAFNSVTFSELDQMADALVLTLKERGIGPGDRIALLHPPCAEVAALFFAVWRIGAAICPLNTRLPPSQIELHLQRLKATLFIDAFPITNPLREKSHPLPYPATLLFTSGSTGTPKIAVLPLANLIANAQSAIKTFELNPQDRWLLNLPLYHVGGIGILLRCILARANCSQNSLDSSITHLSAVPTQLYRATPVYKNLRCLLIGGAPIQSYPNRLPCYLSYGLTEMGSVVTAALRPKDPRQTGMPLEGREIKINPNGEICVKGTSLFQGYWEGGQVTSPLDCEGWFATGDLGSYGTDGLSILGRKDWQFISGGENIQPEEIERELLSLPNIIDAAIVPISDAEFGQRPSAFIKTSDPSLTPESIKTALLDRLPKFKIPASYYFLENLPKNGLKIDRKTLIQMAKTNFH